MDAGDVNGAYNLGLLCAEQGRTAQAEQWYRRAAYAGHREAANALAILLLQVGDAAGAEPWFSKAAEAGQRGRRVQPRHPARRAGTEDDDAAALRWYERAAAAGHTEAALQVAIARLRDGDEREAERHLRCAAGGGSAEAAFRLAAVLDARRPPAPAHELGEPHAGEERVRGVVRAGGRPRGTGGRRCGSGCWPPRGAMWWRRLGGTARRRRPGRRNGAFNLGLLLAREGSEPEAALWWARAADAGHGRAALRLALARTRVGGSLPRGSGGARPGRVAGARGGLRAGGSAAGCVAAGAVRVTRGVAVAGAPPPPPASVSGSPRPRRSKRRTPYVLTAGRAEAICAGPRGDVLFSSTTRGGAAR